MDPLTDFLDGPRARNAFLLHVLMEPPWAIEVADDAPLTLVAALTGEMWLRPTGLEPQRLPAGAVAVIQAGRPYLVASDTSVPPDIRIGPDQSCSSAEGLDLSDHLGVGLRQWGNDRHGRDTMLVASYHSRAEVGRLLTRALPDVFVLPAPPRHYLDALVAEVRGEELAQNSMLDRLLDIVLVSVVRAWARELPAAEQTWLAASRDEVVADALKIIHARADEGWTVQSLADRVGVSRAVLARRFGQVVGVSPISYLNDWRLSLAADLVVEGRLTLSTISRRVGYGGPFSLSAAFKSRYGLSPSAYRTRAVGASSGP